jgi:hypothetical protein
MGGGGGRSIKLSEWAIAAMGLGGEGKEDDEWKTTEKKKLQHPMKSHILILLSLKHACTHA